MITSLIGAVILIGILVLIVGTILKVATPPAPVPLVMWCIVGIVCLVVLWVVVRKANLDSLI